MENIPNGPSIKNMEENGYEGLLKDVPFAGEKPNISYDDFEKEKINFENFEKILMKVAKHPAFSFEESGRDAYYDDKKKQELYMSLQGIIEQMDQKYQNLSIPRRLEAILAEDEESYPFNDDYSDVTARTAHGLVCGKGGNCIGFSELCCTVLSVYRYKPTPMLARLNKTGAACHYVTCVENDDGEVEIIDPERKRSCDEVEKQYSLVAYQGSLRYAVPTHDFSKIKIGGKNGIGPTFDEYFADKSEQIVRPITFIMEMISPNDDTASMYEASSSQALSPRINLKNNSLSQKKKEVLDKSINIALRPFYDQSINLMEEE